MDECDKTESSAIKLSRVMLFASIDIESMCFGTWWRANALRRHAKGSTLKLAAYQDEREPQVITVTVGLRDRVLIELKASPIERLGDASCDESISS